MLADLRHARQAGRVRIEAPARGRLRMYTCGPDRLPAARTSATCAPPAVRPDPAGPGAAAGAGGRLPEHHRRRATWPTTPTRPGRRGQGPGPGAGRGTLDRAGARARTTRTPSSPTRAALNLRPPEHTPRASETIDADDRADRQADRAGARLRGPGRLGLLRRRVLPRPTARSPATGSTRCGPATASRPSIRASASTPTGRCGSPPSGELTWDTPWGRGFPGWHIECSAMSLQLPRRAHRPAHRRHRPALPAPRGRARPVRRGGRARGRAALGARRAPALRRPQDGQVHRQRGAALRTWRTRASTRWPCGWRSWSTATASR